MGSCFSGPFAWWSRGRWLTSSSTRSNPRSACSLGFKPILSKRADCRSPSDGGVQAGGGIAVEKDDRRNSRRPKSSAVPARMLPFQTGSNPGCRSGSCSALEPAVSPVAGLGPSQHTRKHGAVPLPAEGGCLDAREGRTEDLLRSSHELDEGWLLLLHIGVVLVAFMAAGRRRSIRRCCSWRWRRLGRASGSSAGKARNQPGGQRPSPRRVSRLSFSATPAVETERGTDHGQQRRGAPDRSAHASL